MPRWDDSPTTGVLSREVLSTLADSFRAVVSIHRKLQGVEVMGLTTLDGAIEDPSIEPLFMIIIDTGIFKWNIATKDGTSYRFLFSDYAPDGGCFSPENKSMVREAIKRYVAEVTAQEIR